MSDTIILILGALVGFCLVFAMVWIGMLVVSVTFGLAFVSYTAIFLWSAVLTLFGVVNHIVKEL
jgi:hypothetical protein